MPPLYLGFYTQNLSKVAQIAVYVNLPSSIDWELD